MASSTSTRSLAAIPNSNAQLVAEFTLLPSNPTLAFASASSTTASTSFSINYSTNNGHRFLQKTLAQPQSALPLQLPFLMNPPLDPGFKEVINRVREMKCAFGLNDVDHFCVQVKDYMGVLLDREKNRLEYQGSSPQKAGRPSVVKLMMKVAETEKLTRSTLHLSVYLYDRFSDFHVIPVPQLFLVAICCIIIAGKLEERDLETPKMKKLRSFLPPSSFFTYKLFTDLEKFILDYFKWSILVPNAYTFLEFFLLFIIEGTEKQVGQISSFESNNNNDFQVSTSKSKGDSSQSPFRQIHEDPEIVSTRNINTTRLFAIEVLDVLLHEEPNDRFPPSLVAASTLMFARRVFGFFEWSERLEFVTSYSRIQTLYCCEEYVKKVYESHSRCACREPFSSSPLPSSFQYNIV